MTLRNFDHLVRVQVLPGQPEPVLGFRLVEGALEIVCQRHVYRFTLTTPPVQLPRRGKPKPE